MNPKAQPNGILGYTNKVYLHTLTASRQSAVADFVCIAENSIRPGIHAGSLVTNWETEKVVMFEGYAAFEAASEAAISSLSRSSEAATEAAISSLS